MNTAHIRAQSREASPPVAATTGIYWIVAHVLSEVCWNDSTACTAACAAAGFAAASASAVFASAAAAVAVSCMHLNLSHVHIMLVRL
jgi:hypothetical protein